MLIKDAKCSFELTRAAATGFQHHAHLSPVVLRCHGLYVLNDDLIRPGGWVLYASATSSEPQCGRVDEILLRATDGAPFGILVCKAIVEKSASLPYRFPAVTLREGEYEFMSVQDVLCAVNVFHNCAKHDCRPARIKPIMQERQETSLHALEIVHTESTSFILNLAQLHNADIISHFRPTDRYPGLPREEIVQRAVAHRLQILADAAQKKIDAAEKKAQAAEKRAAAAQKKKQRDEERAQQGAAGETMQSGEKRRAEAVEEG
uniref:Rim20 protein n=1 Tax=Ganoderma boninense TaxID=34458 RepID=A0A5K1K2T3_9APHY|nr:Rim20 protein [Ganoderma boninense]